MGQSWTRGETRLMMTSLQHNSAGNISNDGTTGDYSTTWQAGTALSKNDNGLSRAESQDLQDVKQADGF